MLAGLIGTAQADQNDPRLDALFEVLGAATSVDAARRAEFSIWQVWLEGGDPVVDELMGDGVAAMAAGDLSLAEARFSAVVERAPGFAEGWNKRATVYYLQGRLDESVRDIERTLALEARHFGAMSGMGLIFLHTGDEVGALRAFEAVLRVHPFSPTAAQQAERLKKMLESRGA